MKALREVYHSFFNLSTRWRGWFKPCYARFNPRDLVPFVQEAGPVWTSRENLPPPHFELQTVQPVVRLYIEYAILTTLDSSSESFARSHIPKVKYGLHKILFICLWYFEWCCVTKISTQATHVQDGFGGLVVSILVTGTRVRGFKPGLPSEGK